MLINQTLPSFLPSFACAYSNTHFKLNTKSNQKMSFATSTPIQYRLYGDATTASASRHQSYQILEVRLRYLHRLVYVSPSAGVPPQIIHETAPTPLNNAVFHLSLRQLQDPLPHITQMLSSLNIRAAACGAIAQHIASHIIQTASGNRDTNFRIVVEVEYIRLITWMETVPGLYQNGGALVEGTVVLEEAPPARRGVKVAESAMEKLEANGEEELGDCSICLEEINCNGNKRGVIKIPCGHVYHQSCIFKWLNNSNSCPLCRSPLPLEDSE